MKKEHGVWKAEGGVNVSVPMGCDGVAARDMAATGAREWHADEMEEERPGMIERAGVEKNSRRVTSFGAVWVVWQAEMRWVGKEARIG